METNYWPGVRWLLTVPLFLMGMVMEPALSYAREIDHSRITLGGKRVKREPPAPPLEKATPAPDSSTPIKNETPPPEPPKKMAPEKVATPPPLKEKRSVEASLIPRLAVGIAYKGAQVRWRPLARWALEARYLVDSATSEEGTVTAQVMTGRLVRFTRPYGRVTPYFGLEGGAISLDVENSNDPIKGTALGALGGAEILLSRRFSFGMDVGAYQISLENDVSGVKESGMDFVVNSYVNVRIF